VSVCVCVCVCVCVYVCMGVCVFALIVCVCERERLCDVQDVKTSDQRAAPYCLYDECGMCMCV